MSSKEDEFAKLFASDAVAALRAMVKDDFNRYTDPGTGKLRSEIATQSDSCPVCAESHKGSTLVFQKGPFCYWRCGSCAAVYVNPRLNDAGLDFLYSEGRCRKQLEWYYLPSADFRAREIYPRKLAEIEAVRPKGALLDFGCSTGYFMKTAKDRGWSVHGVELNPFAVEWAKTKLGIESVFLGDIAVAPFTPGQFDVITLWDVLEHVPDPAAILRSLRPLLNPEGLLVIETSHFDCAETDILGADNTNLVGDMHLVHFSSRSLQLLLEHTGFAQVKIESFGLDLQHAISWAKSNSRDDIRLPVAAIAPLQRCIDVAGKGCYLKAWAQRSAK